jgi:hypothetical protein
MFRAASMGNGFHAAGGMDGQEAAAGGRAPELGASDTFDIVLGSDICYEAWRPLPCAAFMGLMFSTQRRIDSSVKGN